MSKIMIPGVRAAAALALLFLGNSQPSAASSFVPEVNPRAYYVDTTVCTVVIKSQINASLPLQQGTPVDALVGLPANCTSSVSGLSQVSGGVRQLMGQGHRLTGVSHSVAVLGSTQESRTELLISAIFTLERPQAAVLPPGTR